MSLIPFRTKRSAGMEPGLTTLADFRNEMNRLVEGFFSRPLAAPSWFDTVEPGQWLPTVDMAETDTGIRIRAELPPLAFLMTKDCILDHPTPDFEAAEEAERLFQTQACWGSIIHKIYILGPKL